MNLKSSIPVSHDPRGAESHPFMALQREIDRIFENFTRGLPSFTRGRSALMPNMDVTETDSEIEISAELPGLEEKDVQINVADNVLTIRGEKRAEKEEKDTNYRLVERSYGLFERMLELPHGVNPDDIKASIAKGVLKVTVPKPTATQAKKIEVKPAA